MTGQYLVLAVLLAVTLNHANRFIRAGGTLLAAIGLMFIVASIVLADTDGTFAALPWGLMDVRPIVLNGQAILACLAVLFLLWAAWRQLDRRVPAPVPWRNTGSGFGLVSRYAHWASATLILCLVPIGLFMTVLPQDSADRAVFVAVHQTLGVTVLVLLLLRLAWLSRSAPPPLPAALTPHERLLARTLHKLLYAVILGLPVTGILLSLSQGEPIELYGWVLPAKFAPNAGSPWLLWHDLILPVLFSLVIALHLAAVLKHHFVSGRVADIRRMLR
jgi:cytochrome b561